MIRVTNDYREDELRNHEYIKGSIGVALIANKMRENRFKWFWAYFKRRDKSKISKGNMYLMKVRKRKTEKMWGM